MAALTAKLVWIMHGEIPGGPSGFFFIACTEVNAYLVMEFFIKRDGDFINFR